MNRVINKSTKNITTFATIVFNQAIVNVEPVVLCQFNQGLGIGTTINCAKCLLVVDEIIDDPEKHQKFCQDYVD